MSLTREQLAFYIGLLKYKTIINNGYIYFRPKNKIYGNKKYKRSRIRMILSLNRVLSINEKVKFKDKNKLNDSIDNLYLD